MFEGKPPQIGNGLSREFDPGQGELRPVTWADLRAKLDAARDLRVTIAAHQSEGDASFASGCARHIAAICDAKPGVNLEDLVNGKAMGGIRRSQGHFAASDAPRK